MLFSLILDAFIPHFLLEDLDNGDMENVPVMPEIETIEVQAFYAQVKSTTKSSNNINYKLHRSCILECSKMAGWHHVRYSIPEAIHSILIPGDIY
jgi:hypothetical protein